MLSNIFSEFESASREICIDIRLLRKEILIAESQLRQSTIGEIGENEERGDHYKLNITRYISGLKEISKNFERKILFTAGLITGFSASFPEVPKEKTDSLWLSFALALEPLALRPSKKFSAILVNKEQRLVAWSVNRIYPGLPEAPDLYVKGENGRRGKWMQCAERAVLADSTSFIPPKFELTNGRNSIASYTAFYDKLLYEHLLKNKKMVNLTLYSSYFPCLLCYNMLTKENHRKLVCSRIVTQWDESKINGITSPYRNIRESYIKFTQNGLAISIVSPIF